MKILQFRSTIAAIAALLGYLAQCIAPLPAIISASTQSSGSTTTTTNVVVP